MKIIFSKFIILISILIRFYILSPNITLKILQKQNLINEINLNFEFYMKYSEIISHQEFSSVYKIIFISNNSTISQFSKNKNEKQILLFDSFSTFSTKKVSNMSNIILFPDKYKYILNKDLLTYFDNKQFIFFIDQKQYDELIYDLVNDNEINAKFFIPKEISENFLNNNENSTIPEYYFILMFLTFIIFFLYLFHYNFLVPLMYKDFWLFFISQFYLFIPLRFILLVLLSIKLIVIQNTRGLFPSAPGFFVILAVQKSLIKTNIITTIILANEGLYIFENMKKIIRKMTIYKLQYIFLTIFLILLLSFPFHLIIIILDSFLCPIILIHALVNFRRLKKTLKIAILSNKKKYIPFIKLKISIWIKQNILLNIYFISIIIIYFYSKYSTNKLQEDEIICLKSDMLEFCVENLFLFAFCYLYRPRHLEKYFFVIYTEKFDSMNLKFYYTELKKDNSLKNKLIDMRKNESYLNKKNIINFRKKFIKKPIIILNPRIIYKAEEYYNEHHRDKNMFIFNEKFSISIGKVK